MVPVPVELSQVSCLRIRLRGYTMRTGAESGPKLVRDVMDRDRPS